MEIQERSQKGAGPFVFGEGLLGKRPEEDNIEGAAGLTPSPSPPHRFLSLSPIPLLGWAETRVRLHCSAQHGLCLRQNLILIGVQTKELDTEAIHGV